WKALIELHDEFAETPFLLDAKRGDMGNTMKAYAHAVFTTLAMDAATVSPYFGIDSIEEFTRYEDRGVYVVCRSSNPGAEDLQHLDADGAPLFLRVADMSERANRHGNVGLVVGATAPSAVADVRKASKLPFLIPGIGTQGGDVSASVRAAWNGDPASCLLSVSRGVLSDAGHKARLVLTGHIIDSMILPQVMDLVMDLGGNFTIEELRVGQHKTDTSYCRMEVVASTAQQLDTIVKGARALGAASESERPARLERVIKEGVFPEGFYSTSNLPTEVFLDG